MAATDTPRIVARVGLISDTHGKVDARVHDALAGVDAVLHAGDIGTAGVLTELMAISPAVTAVMGNCDYSDYGWDVGVLSRTTVAGVRFLVIHELDALGPIPPDVDVVVCGHTHRPSIQHHGRVLVVNPGSASQRRREPSRTVGIVEIAEDGSAHPRIVALDDIAPARLD